MVTADHVRDQVVDAIVENDAIVALELRSGNQLQIAPNTLVIDAMGARSPVMAKLSAEAETVIDQPGQLTYVTQFFRLDRKDCDSAGLPDPLIDCPARFWSGEGDALPRSGRVVFDLACGVIAAKRSDSELAGSGSVHRLLSAKPVAWALGRCRERLGANAYLYQPAQPMECGCF